MFILLVVITLVTIITGRIAMRRWLNLLSIFSAVCVLVLLLFGLIGDKPLSGVFWFYLLSGWLCLYLGAVVALLVRGPPAQEQHRRSAWEQRYLCQITSGKDLPPRTSWELFVLLGLQCVLLGASNEIDVGKIIFDGIYLCTLLLWSRRIVSYGFARQESIVRWTAMLMALGLFSRFSGMYLGVSTSDWIRDFLPLLHFSWILVGPLAFISRKSISQAYLIFVGVVLLLTFVVTDDYITLRGFSVEGLGLIKYIRASDGVVLFGVFMTAPMIASSTSRSRFWFSLLTAGFVGAALLTGTRSHVIAILVGLVFYFWLTLENEKVAASRGLAVFGSVALGIVIFGLTLYTGLVDFQQVAERVEQVGSTDYQGIAYRYQEAVGAWEGFQRSPVFGQGLGYAIPTVFIDSGPVESDLFIVHDFYMYIPLKFGIIGIVIFLGFLISMVRTAISTYRQAKEPFDKAFAAGLASLLIALLIESITSSRFTDRTPTALLAILFAILLSIRREIALGHVLLTPVETLAGSQAGLSGSNQRFLGPAISTLGHSI